MDLKIDIEYANIRCTKKSSNEKSTINFLNGGGPCVNKVQGRNRPSYLSSSTI